MHYFTTIDLTSFSKLCSTFIFLNICILFQTLIVQLMKLVHFSILSNNYSTVKSVSIMKKSLTNYWSIDIKFKQLHWLLDKNSGLSVENKLLMNKTILTLKTEWFQNKRLLSFSSIPISMYPISHSKFYYPLC